MIAAFEKTPGVDTIINAQQQLALTIAGILVKMGQYVQANRVLEAAGLIVKGTASSSKALHNPFQDPSIWVSPFGSNGQEVTGKPAIPQLPQGSGAINMSPAGQLPLES